MRRRLRLLTHWLSQPSASLRQQVARGAIWLAAGDCATALLGLVKLTVIARLLTPEHFGLFGIALLLSGWLDFVTELGFRDALIQRQGDVAPYMDTVWTAQLIRGTAVAALVLACSPLVAWYYANPDVALGMQLIAVDPLLRSLTNPATIYLRKRLDLMRDVRWRLIGPSAGLVSGIVLALVLRNAWALFLSLLIATTAQVIASYAIYPYRPRLSFDRSRARDLIAFGQRLFWLRLIGALNWYVDGVVVSKMLGLAAVAHYQMAVRLASLPGTIIGAPFHGVLFPTFAKLQTLRHRREALAQALAITLCLTLPIAVCLTLLSPFVVDLLLGPAWESMAGPLRVLSWLAVTQPLGHVLNAFFMATGRVELDVRVATMRALILVTAIYPVLLAFGIIGVAWVAMVAALFAMFYQLVLAAGSLHTRPLSLLRCLHGGILASVPLLLAWPFAHTASMPSAIAVSTLSGGLSIVIAVSMAWRVFATHRLEFTK